MATATKEKRSRSKAAKEEPAFVDVPVEFGGVSIGESTARLGVRISREHLSLTKADECFCGHRLTGRVQLGGNGDAGGQMSLVEDLHQYVDGSFDVKRIGVSPDTISTGLTFSLKDISVADLAGFSKGSGRLRVKEVAALPDGKDEDGDDDEDEGDDE